MATPAWLANRMTKPCVIHSRIAVGTDEYNNPMYADGPDYPTVCYLQPFSQTEVLDGRAGVATYLMHLPASAAGVLDGFAWVDVDGLSYEAVEPPAAYPSFFEVDVHHVEIVVQRSTA
jgi:hypothetical protein